MIEVELRRAHIPEELGERDCPLCGWRFRSESVVIVAHGVNDESSDAGHICPTCLTYMHARNPQRFPSLAQYVDAVRRYPDPVWSSVEEVIELEKRQDYAALNRGYEAAEIS